CVPRNEQRAQFNQPAAGPSAVEGASALQSLADGCERDVARALTSAAAREPAAGAFRVPPLIRRNTLLLALSQAFTGAGMGLVYSIGPLMIVGVSGSTALSGLSVTLMGIS